MKNCHFRDDGGGDGGFDRQLHLRLLEGPSLDQYQQQHENQL